MKFRKIPKKFSGIVMPVILSALMSCVISGVNTLRFHGINPEFFHEWAGAWVVSWMIALPALLTLLPIARRLVKCVVES